MQSCIFEIPQGFGLQLRIRVLKKICIAMPKEIPSKWSHRVRPFSHGFHLTGSRKVKMLLSHEWDYDGRALTLYDLDLQFKKKTLPR